MLLLLLLTITSFIGGAYLILDATAGERERQSLEPLLAQPTSRLEATSRAASRAVGRNTRIVILVANNADWPW